MFVGITNTPVPNAWGSTTAIAELLGREPSGGPEAELWLGTHHGSPSRLSDGSGSLPELLEAHGHEPLSILLKVLAASAPLSLQAHPTREQAESGFAREEALGIPRDAPERNYRDPFPKPEMVVALTPFRALCGFRPVAESLDALGTLRAFGAGLVTELMDRLETGSLREAFAWLLTGPDAAALVAEVSEVAQRTSEFPTLAELARRFPGDPGIVVSLLLHEVELEPGQSLFLPAGNIHAYLEGLGIELMTASDNVLRGGLTPKHVDVPELLTVLDFTPGPVPYLRPRDAAPGVTLWEPPADFRLARIEGPATLELTGPAVLIAVSGAGSVRGERSTWTFERGDAAFSSADEGSLSADSGVLFVATTR